MKYLVLSGIIVAWVIAAFFYRASGREGTPRTWVALSASVVFTCLTLALSEIMGARPLEAPRELFIISAVGGIGFIAAMPLFMAAVARGSIGVSWTILTLSFAAASLLSIVYPGKSSISATGVVGLVFAAGAIAFLGRDSVTHGESRGFKRGWGLFIALAFAANTVCLYVPPVVDAHAPLELPENKMAMLLTQTIIFALGSAVLCAVMPAAGSRARAIKVGAGVGTALCFGNYLVTLALGDFAVPAYIFFPVTTGGSTLAVALLAAVVYGERPGGLGWIGLALGLVSMVLLGRAA